MKEITGKVDFIKIKNFRERQCQENEETIHKLGKDNLEDVPNGLSSKTLTKEHLKLPHKKTNKQIIGQGPSQTPHKRSYTGGK